MGKSSARIALVLVAAIAVLTIAHRSIVAAPVFQGIGDAPGGGYYSSASDISDDGKVVVGNGGTMGISGASGFRWTAAGGMQQLGFYWGVNATNADGSTIVGGDQRWTPATGTVVIEGLRLPGDIPYPENNATGVSGDGSVIVGPYDDFEQRSFRWEGPRGPAHGVAGFGPIDVSFDGQTMIGYVAHAVKYQAATGIVPLGELPNEQLGFAISLSYDTNTIVGYSMVSGSDEPRVAWRWTSTGGMVPLGSLSGQAPRASFASDVSSDGAIVVGLSGNYQHPQAFIWAEHLGMLSLQDWLTANHVDGLTRWQLTEARGISADGRSIVGSGINPDGNTEAWLVRLPSLGDTNSDGLVDGADYIAWADHFNQASNLFAEGDLNWDGIVDGADYVIWADHFAPNRASVSVSAVPEPSSFVLACLGVAALLARRKRSASVVGLSEPDLPL